MKTEYVTLLTVVCSMISGLGGAYITGYFSGRARIDAIKGEREIEKKKEAERNKKKLIGLYVSIVKIDYGKRMTYPSALGFIQINDEVYDEQIRERIYENYHLIHESVIEKFNVIEQLYQKLSYEEYYDSHDYMVVDEDVAANTYMEMIKEIKKILDKERIIE